MKTKKSQRKRDAKQEDKAKEEVEFNIDTNLGRTRVIS